MIVTGAGQGIGRALAKGLAAEGARVVIAELNGENGKRVQKDIEAAGGMALTTPLPRAASSALPNRWHWSLLLTASRLIVFVRARSIRRNRKRMSKTKRSSTPKRRRYLSESRAGRGFRGVGAFSGEPLVGVRHRTDDRSERRGNSVVDGPA